MAREEHEIVGVHSSAKHPPLLDEALLLYATRHGDVTIEVPARSQNQ